MKRLKTIFFITMMVLDIGVGLYSGEWKLIALEFVCCALALLLLPRRT